MLIQMKIEELIIDKEHNAFALLLREKDGTSALPIWIGPAEAESIALALGEVETPRPLTHDLVKKILASFDISLSKVVITKIIDNTYFADIHLTNGDREIPVDARPSDAIATALRTNTPIYVKKEILEKKDKDDIRDWIDNVTPKDFEDDSK